MRASLLLAALVLLSLPASAQTPAPGRWLDTLSVPGAYPSASGGTVRAAVADGGGALVGGSFAQIDGVDASGVARWTRSAWEAVGGGVRLGPGDGVEAIARDPQGGIWIAGRFTAVVQPDGSLLDAAGLARWTGGAWEIPGQLLGNGSDAPYGLALLVEGGSVYVSGSFANLLRPNGTRLGSSGLARWTDGTWRGFGQRGGWPIARAPGGGVLFADFALVPGEIGGMAVFRIDDLAVTQVTSVFDVFATATALLTVDDQIVVAGDFQRAYQPDRSVVNVNRIARWDGARWQALGSGIPGSSAPFALMDDGAGGLLAGKRAGQMWQDGVLVDTPGLVRWDGASWSPVPFAERSGPSEVRTLARLGAATFVGGTFRAAGGTGAATRRASNLAVLSAAGEVGALSARTGRDGALSGLVEGGNGPATSTRVVAPDGCGGVRVAAGPNGSAGPLPGGAVQRWDGHVWQSAADGAEMTQSNGFPYALNALAADPRSCDAFVLGGRFRGLSIGGAPVESDNVVRFDGTAWQTLGRGTSGDVRALAVAGDGRVFAGGDFIRGYQADGRSVEAYGVAQWTEAAGWAPMGDGLRCSGCFASVDQMLLDTDGTLVVSGRFDEVVGLDGPRAARSVARWTGAAWETFGGPVPDRAVAARPHPATWLGSDLVVAGSFVAVEQPDGTEISAPGLAAFDGARWRALPALPETAEVRGLSVLDGRLVAAAGDVWRLDGAAWARLGAATTVSRLSDESAPGVTALAVVERRLYAAGRFETLGGVGSPGVAVFDLDGAVSAEILPAEARTGRLFAFPNPARGATSLRFTSDGPARLVVLDLLGRTVAVVLNDESGTGERTVRIDTSRLPAGVYVARLDAGGATQTARITVVR